jgi:hypothetical protein
MSAWRHTQVPGWSASRAERSMKKQVHATQGSRSGRRGDCCVLLVPLNSVSGFLFVAMVHIHANSFSSGHVASRGTKKVQELVPPSKGGCEKGDCRCGRRGRVLDPPLRQWRRLGNGQCEIRVGRNSSRRLGGFALRSRRGIRCGGIESSSPFCAEPSHPQGSCRQYLPSG